MTTDLSTILHHSPDGSSVSGRTSHACAIFERRSSCPRSQPCDTAQGSQFLAHDSRIDAPSHMAISHIDETMFHRTTQTRTGRFQASSSVSNSRFTCVRPSCSITSETSLQPAHAFSAANFTSRLPFHPYKLPPPPKPHHKLLSPIGPPNRNFSPSCLAFRGTCCCARAGGNRIAKLRICL